MNSSIMERVLKEAECIIKTEYTIRQIADLFNVSKSTVHKDLHERLKLIDEKLYKRVDKIMKYHLNIRHIRGGESTRKKYENKQKNI